MSHTLPNSGMVNYDFLKEQIWQIDKNCPFSMPTWLIILIMVPHTLMAATGIPPIAIANIDEQRISHIKLSPECSNEV